MSVAFEQVQDPRPLASVVLDGPTHVLGWTIDADAYASTHEEATRRAHAQRLAELQRMTYAGVVRGPSLTGTTHASGEAMPPLAAGRAYLVPSDTIVGLDRGHALGIRSETDFFGGLVPHAFVATKAISHGLFDERASAPDHWATGLGGRIRSSVLDGYSAYSAADARRAGRRLLAEGSVRIKPVRATGGRGQYVARDECALDRVISSLASIEEGVVLERNLREPKTLSIGQVTIAGLRVSYYGVQRLTTNHQGEQVYGGSDLIVVRGDLEALHALNLAPSLKLAINQVRAYHAAVVDAFPGFLASRINYDVAQGRDDGGRWCSGVLEQSWRIGGATGAEVAALQVDA